MMDRKSYVTFIVIFIPVVLFGQINSKKKNRLPDNYLGVELDFGLTTFYGDIDEGSAQGKYFPNNLAYGLQVYKSFGSLFLLGGELLLGNVSGEKNRNEGTANPTLRYFKARFIEYTLTTQFNLVALFSNNIRHRVNFYAKVGIGLTDFRTRLYDGSNDSVIKSFGYDGQESTTELVIPLGLKLVYNVSSNFAVSLESTMKRSDTDKLDGVTGNDNRDYYNFTSLGLIFKICSDNNCGPISGSKKIKSNKTKRPKSKRKSGIKRHR
jgi:hypothetical protein